MSMHNEMQNAFKSKEKYTIDIKHPGKLHDRLGIPEGTKIPLEKLHEAANSKEASLRKEAQFALNARKFKQPSEKK